MAQTEKRESRSSTVKEANGSRQDLASHSSMKAPQSDRQPWNYKSITPQEQARIDAAWQETEKRIREKEEDRERDEKRKKREQKAKEFEDQSKVNLRKRAKEAK